MAKILNECPFPRKCLRAYHCEMVVRSWGLLTCVLHEQSRVFFSLAFVVGCQGEKEALVDDWSLGIASTLALVLVCFFPRPGTRHWLGPADAGGHSGPRQQLRGQALRGAGCEGESSPVQRARQGCFVAHMLGKGDFSPHYCCYDVLGPTNGLFVTTALQLHRRKWRICAANRPCHICRSRELEAR